MVPRRGPRRTWVLVLVAVAAVALVTAIVGLQPSATLLGRLIRAMALTAYLALFLASLASAVTSDLVRFFGRPFVRVHHALSITGLAMIVLHPVAYAVQTGSLEVFVPVVSSLAAFLRWGGRLGLYLFLVAALAAAVRKALGGNWRLVHLLNYGAFVLVTVHAALIGTDFQTVWARAIAAAMAAVVVGVLIRRRVKRRGR